MTYGIKKYYLCLLQEPVNCTEKLKHQRIFFNRLKKRELPNGGERMRKNGRGRKTFREILEEEKDGNLAALEQKTWIANQLAHKTRVSWRARKQLFSIKQCAVEQAICRAPERYRVSEVSKTYIGVTSQTGFRIHILRRCFGPCVRKWLAAELDRRRVRHIRHTNEAA